MGAPSLRPGLPSGKFQGANAATGPTGSWVIVLRWMTVRQAATHVAPAWIVPVVGLTDIPLAMPLLLTVARRGLRARSAGPAAAPEQEAGYQQEHRHQAHEGRDPARSGASHHADMQRV